MRAHLAARERGLPLIIGTEFTLRDGTEARGCSPPTAQATAILAASSRAAGALAAKGSYALTRDDLEGRSAGCLALWLPRHRARTLPAAQLAHGRWLRERFGDARGSPSSCSPAAAMRGGSSALRRARPSRWRCRWWRPATCTCTCAPPRAAGHAHRDPPAARRCSRRATRCIRTASGTCAAARGCASSIRRRCWPRRARSPSAAASRSTSCATSTRKRSCRPARRPTESSARARPHAAACALSLAAAAAPAEVRELIEHELALIAELQATSPTS